MRVTENHGQRVRHPSGSLCVGMAEWFIAPDLESGRPLRVSRGRIPLPPHRPYWQPAETQTSPLPCIATSSQQERCHAADQ